MSNDFCATQYVEVNTECQVTFAPLCVMIVNDGLGEVSQGVAMDCPEAVHRNFVELQRQTGVVCVRIDLSTPCFPE
jgi:hypothetical protein